MLTEKKLHTRANDIVDADAIVDELNGLEAGTKPFAVLNATQAQIGIIAKPDYSEITSLNDYTGTVLFRKEASGNNNLFISITVPNPIVSNVLCQLPTEGYNPNAFISFSLITASNGVAVKLYIGLDGTVSFETAPTVGATYKGILLYAV